MSAPPITVACLCAAWCRTCDAYREVFESATAELRAAGFTVTAHWIDIEDQAELVGELDVETFPTLLVAQGDQVRFFGPLEPQPETLARMLRSAADASAAGGAGVASTTVIALAQRLARR
jgi:thioredoxin 1